MKILVYGINYPPEFIGIAKYTGEMTNWLLDKGHEVKVITAMPYYPAWEIPSNYRKYWYMHEANEGVDVIRCPLYVPKSPTGLRRIWHHLSFAASSSGVVVARAQQFKPDVIFSVAPSLFTSPAAVLAARLSGALAWLHIQDFEIDAAFELGLLSSETTRRYALGFERWILHQFDGLSSISQKMVETLSQKGIGLSRIVEFRNWVDTNVIVPRDRQTAYRRMLGISPDTIVVLYSGNMSNKQGLEYVIAAARDLSQKDLNIVFVLCGSGPTRNRLVADVDNLKNVRFLDLQPPDRLSEFLGTADIHLLPQRAEAADLVLPSKLAGILSSGRPVIVMARPETQLAAEVAGVGVVVPPGEVASLASAIVELAVRPELRSRLGRAARAAAIARWEKETIMKAVEQRLVALIAERRESIKARSNTLMAPAEPRPDH